MPEKTRYEFIEFIKLGDTGKTSIWSCCERNGNELGQVKWYGQWNQYCYFPKSGCVYHGGCLMKDIAHFLEQLMEERKCQRRNRPSG